MNRIAAMTVAVLLPCLAAVAQTTATITLSADPVDGGKVAGGGLKTVGATASIVATPSNGWRFVTWSDGNAVASRKIVVLPDATNLTASFAISTGTLSFDTALVDLGSVPVSFVGTQAFTVANSGPGAVTVSGLTLPKGFSAAPSKFTVAAGGAQRVVISLKPSATGTLSAPIVLKSNAARITGSLAVTGTGIPQTRIVRIEGDTDCGEIFTWATSTRVLTVYNDGNSPMSVTGATWANNSDKSFVVAPTKLTIPAAGSGIIVVSFTPKMAQRYDTTTLTLGVKSMTGGANAVALHGGATANVQGTWSGTIANTKGSISATAYVWQDGTDVVASVTGNNISGVFAGTVTNRASIEGDVWTNNLYVGKITLTYVAGPKISGATTNGAVKVSLSRKSTTIPSTAVKPDISSLPLPTALPMPQLTLPVATFTVFAPAGGTPLAADADGVCATWTSEDGRMTIGFPQKSSTGIPLVVVKTEGPGANPDAFEAALGGVPPDGAELLVLRLVDGILTLETPYVDALRVEGPSVPADQLPATWQVTPVAK